MDCRTDGSTGTRLRSLRCASAEKIELLEKSRPARSCGDIPSDGWHPSKASNRNWAQEYISHQTKTAGQEACDVSREADKKRSSCALLCHNAPKFTQADALTIGSNSR